MKYTYCESILWHVMSPAIIRSLQQSQPEWNMTKLGKRAKQAYREIVERTPDIGTLKQNPHRINLTGGMVWLAYYHAAQGSMSHECFAGMVHAAMNAPVVKLNYQRRKKRLFTKEGELRQAKLFEKVNKASQSSFNWIAEHTPGRTAEEYRVVYKQCGLCALGRQENAFELVPYMCAVDFMTFGWMGATLYRTKTLAGGFDCCEFYVCKQGSAYDVERSKAEDHN